MSSYYKNTNQMKENKQESPRTSNEDFFSMREISPK